MGKPLNTRDTTQGTGYLSTYSAFFICCQNICILQLSPSKWLAWLPMESCHVSSQSGWLFVPLLVLPLVDPPFALPLLDEPPPLLVEPLPVFPLYEL